MRRDVGDKIDFLMRVTNTQNAVLARALNFDASYISRIRAGKRGLPPGQPFVEPAGLFFARNVREAYQGEALARELGLTGAWPQNQDEAASLLAAWMRGHEGDQPHDAVGVTTAATARPTMGPHPFPRDDEPTSAHLYLGDDGRREGALAFLTEALDAGDARTLLLQSDEDMAWMYEDDHFVHSWTRLMGQLMGASCKVVVVHTPARDANEMWEGVRKWLPLYASGVIEPYYYPRLRDGVRRRSLFVVPDRVALVANSVRDMASDDMLSVMLRDHAAVDALTREFDAYLRLCRPLARRLDHMTPEGLDTLVAGFLAASGEPLAARVGDVLACVKEGHGALVISATRPVAYAVDEPRLTSAIAEHVGGLPDACRGDDGVSSLLASTCGTLTAKGSAR